LRKGPTRGFDSGNALDEALVRARKKNEAVIVYERRSRCPSCNILQSRLRRETVAAPFRGGYVITAIWDSSMDHAERQLFIATSSVE
jgi:hypothetical protein